MGVYNADIRIRGRMDYNDIFGGHHFRRFSCTFHLLELAVAHKAEGVIELPIVSVAKWRESQGEEDDPEDN